MKARLDTGASRLIGSVDWPLCSAIRKYALLTSQIEGTQATLADLFDEEASLVVSSTDDVEEVTNDLRAFRFPPRRDGPAWAHEAAEINLKTNAPTWSDATAMPAGFDRAGLIGLVSAGLLRHQQ